MAGARPVLAAPSEVADYLVDGRTARLVERDSTADWLSHLRQAIEDPGALQALGRGAQEYVREHHGPAAFVSRMLETYREVCGEPLKFEA
jgi:glycosyltransferase involved in cell wall biosynthesis